MHINHLAIGVDIGGSHISCAAVDLVEGKIIADSYSEIEVDSHASHDEIISVWGRALDRTIEKIDIASLRGIGFAMPGP